MEMKHHITLILALSALVLAGCDLIPSAKIDLSGSEFPSEQAEAPDGVRHMTLSRVLQKDPNNTAGLEIQNEASTYFAFQPDKFFEVTVVGQSFGIVHKIVAIALVQDGKVRYLRWQEDP